MPLYIVLGNFTQKGIENIKDMTKWSPEANEVMESIGAKTYTNYFTMGQYDFVSLIEAPDNESMMKALLIRAGVGHIRTETLTAITGEDMMKIVKEIP